MAFAEAGFDVAITARTVVRSDRAVGVGTDAPIALPGSLEETAEAVTAAGGRAHPIRLDLLDRTRIAQAAAEAIDALGRVDVLVNNAIYTGEGNYHRFLDADLDAVDDRINANIVAQLRFTQPVVAHMVEHGGGAVLDMTSGAAYAEPFAMPGEGGWGMAYTVSKAGFHRLATQLAYEYGGDGIHALNVQPGFVATERVKLAGAATELIARRGVEPSTIGAIMAHVATNADHFAPGSTVELQDLGRELNLLPPKPDRT